MPMKLRKGRCSWLPLRFNIADYNAQSRSDLQYGVYWILFCVYSGIAGGGPLNGQQSRMQSSWTQMSDYV